MRYYYAAHILHREKAVDAAAGAAAAAICSRPAESHRASDSPAETALTGRRIAEMNMIVAGYRNPSMGKINKGNNNNKTKNLIDFGSIDKRLGIGGFDFDYFVEFG